MYEFYKETLIQNDSDLEIVRVRLKTKLSVFYKLSFILILLLPIMPFFSKTASYGQKSYTNKDYLFVLFLDIILISTFLLLTYYRSIFLIKKDLHLKTKIKFKTAVKKTKSDDDVRNGTAKTFNILCFPIEIIEDKGLSRSLFFYLKKNIFPSDKLILEVPRQEYLSIENGQGIIEISTHSNTFLRYQELDHIKER